MGVTKLSCFVFFITSLTKVPHGNKNTSIHVRNQTESSQSLGRRHMLKSDTNLVLLLFPAKPDSVTGLSCIPKAVGPSRSTSLLKCSEPVLPIPPTRKDKKSVRLRTAGWQLASIIRFTSLRWTLTPRLNKPQLSVCLYCFSSKLPIINFFPARFTMVTLQTFLPSQFTAVARQTFLPSQFTAVARQTFLPSQFTAVARRNFLLARFITVTRRTFLPSQFITVTLQTFLPSQFTALARQTFLPSRFTAVTRQTFLPSRFITVNVIISANVVFVVCYSDVEVCCCLVGHQLCTSTNRLNMSTRLLLLQSVTGR
uniref:Uncharacterized protein n=1 Tax=Timema poppense TaxID=170557 RepID=A0A7R9DQ33_TIMPO|nr:unnamed protein product [Timema poppensis]